MKTNKVYYTDQAADILNIHIKTLYRYLETGKISGDKKVVDGTYRWVINEKDLFKENETQQYITEEVLEFLNIVLIKLELLVESSILIIGGLRNK